MSLYVSEKVNNQIVLKKYAPAVPVYRGFWAVTIGGFAGTLVECNGSMRYIGSNEKTIYQIVEPGTYTFTATRHGETKSKTIVLDDKDPNNSYTVNLGLYIGMQYLEYIESTGTQYIDTGIFPKGAHTKVVVETLCTKNDDQNGKQIFGSRDAYGVNAFCCSFFNNANDKNLRCQYGSNTNYNITAPSSVLNKQVTYVLDKNVFTVYDKDGTTIGTYSGNLEDFTGLSTIPLFGWYTEGSISIYSDGVRIYSCKIYDDDTLVSDFVPIKDDTNHGALFDKVTQEIFYNSGEGEFICGPNKPYARIHYLESTGTQYINTGVIGTNNTKVEVDYQFTSMVDVHKNRVYGSGTSSSSDALYYAVYNNKFITAYDSEITSTYSSDLLKHTLIQDKNVFTLDGTIINTHPITTFSTPKTMHLFALDVGNIMYYGVVRIYSYKVYDNGTLVRDMIPVLDYDGTPCMYDQVNDRLYYNDGTGEFIAGPEYAELEYIENTLGSFINTGYIPLTTQNLDIDMKFEMDSVNPGMVNGMWGYMNSSTIPRFGLYFDPKYCVGSGVNGTVYWNDKSLTTGVLYNTHLSNGLFTLEHADYSSTIDIGRVSTNQTTYPIYFGARCNENGQAIWPSHLKIYSFKITDSDGPVCNMIPVRRSDGTVCFYDTVSEQFFTNAGTGEFIAGPEKQ